MALDNRISIQISAEDQQAIEQALDTLKTRLQPYLRSLTPQDRRELPKMNDRSVAFVNKSLEYAEGNTTLVPAFLDVAELRKDLEAVDALTQFRRQVEEIYTLVDDTVMLAGSEAYVAALAFYNSVKLGARMNIPGALPVYEDLRERFVGQGRSVEPEPVA